MSQNMNQMKRRQPWIAFLFSLLCPGLGQLYNGNIPWAAGGLVVSAVVAVVSSVYFFDTFLQLLQALFLGLVIDLFFALHACWQAKELGVVALKSFQRWWVYLGFTAVLYGLPGGYGLIIPERFLSFQIPSESMVPTLLVGDRLVADGWAYWKDNPKRGDIVVFDYPRDPSIKFVKRVVGLPGDEVKIVGGELYVNRVLVQAHRTTASSTNVDGWGVVEYLETLGPLKHRIHRSQPTMTMTFSPVTVPEKKYFVMGDNRDRSSDSRVWGFVPVEAIVGRMKYVYFSWDSSASALRWDRVGLPVE